MNDGGETCPNLLLSESYAFLLFYFIAFPVHYIKSVCSNISQIYNNSAVDRSSHLGALVDNFIFVCIK